VALQAAVVVQVVVQGLGQGQEGWRHHPLGWLVPALVLRLLEFLLLLQCIAGLHHTLRAWEVPARPLGHLQAPLPPLLLVVAVVQIPVQQQIGRGTESLIGTEGGIGNERTGTEAEGRLRPLPPALLLVARLEGGAPCPLPTRVAQVALLVPRVLEGGGRGTGQGAERGTGGDECGCMPISVSCLRVGAVWGGVCHSQE
jgi:hypothetical protein